MCRRSLYLSVLVAALIALAACQEGDPLAEDAPGDDPDGAEEGDAPEVEDDTGALTIGAFGFGESLILAELYGQALEAGGFEIADIQQVGAREATFPALEGGDIDFLPEYNGNALQFVIEGEVETTDSEETTEQLRSALADQGIAVLEHSPAENGDELVMTAERAEELGVEQVSDLIDSADELTVAGPVEFQERFTGAVGLEEVYGITFGEFLQTDACGPETFEALRSGAADVARMCSTDPPIAQEGWVILEEDRPFTLANNIVPVVREAVLTDEMADVINAVSAELTIEDLQDFNVRFTDDEAPEDADQIAASWLEAQGLD